MVVHLLPIQRPTLLLTILLLLALLRRPDVLLMLRPQLLLCQLRELVGSIVLWVLGILGWVTRWGTTCGRVLALLRLLLAEHLLLLLVKTLLLLVSVAHRRRRLLLIVCVWLDDGTAFKWIPWECWWDNLCTGVCRINIIYDRTFCNKSSISIFFPVYLQSLKSSLIKIYIAGFFLSTYIHMYFAPNSTTLTSLSYLCYFTTKCFNISTLGLGVKIIWINNE